MRFYFKLQYKRLYRTSAENGSNLFVGLFITSLLFIVGSVVLIDYFKYGTELYILALIICLNYIGTPDHIYFLKHYFSKRFVLKIRLVENSVIAFPFLIILFIYTSLPYFVIGLSTSILLALSNGFKLKNHIVYTPFYKKPFEFIIGFRNSWFILIGIYTITTVALVAYNFNLALVCLFLIFILCLKFYSIAESDEWIFLHKGSSRQFLFLKIKTALKQSIVLVFPVLLALFILYPINYLMILSGLLFGITVLTSGVLAKYAFYPNVQSIIGGLIIVMGVFMPPLLIFTVPYLYSRAKINLNEYLL